MTKEIVTNVLESKIDEVFAECHSVEEIVNGDILPKDNFKLESLKEQMSTLICTILNYQKGEYTL